jgi:hypothetical protein
VLLKPFAVLLFASFSSFARRKRRRGWAAAQIGIKARLATPAGRPALEKATLP